MKLHIVNGSTTADGVRGAGIEGVVVEYADVLHDGPVLPDDDGEAFLDQRASFLAECGLASKPDARRHLHIWEERAAHFRDYDEVVLWYEHDLFDQLLLIRVLNWWWKHAPMDPPSLVSPAAYLGAMSAEELAVHFERRERVTEAQLTLAASAWEAFTATNPRGLVRTVQHENTRVLPHLDGALHRLLDEYPSVYNGLGRTEHQVLEILNLAPLTAFDLFAANARREERVFMGDTTFFIRLRRLLDGPHPLVARNTDAEPLQLTDEGRRVLEGEADNIAINGIDHWIGGVHLTRDSVWRWNGEDCVRA